MNQQAMLRKIKKMQDEMMATQKEIEETVFTASAFFFYFKKRNSNPM